MIIPVDLGEKSYPIIIERGAIGRLGTQVGSSRRVCLVSDSGVPSAHVARATESLEGRGCEVLPFCFPCGEESKNFDTFLALQKTLIQCYLQVGQLRLLSDNFL